MPAHCTPMWPAQRPSRQVMEVPWTCPQTQPQLCMPGAPAPPKLAAGLGAAAAGARHACPPGPHMAWPGAIIPGCCTCCAIMGNGYIGSIIPPHMPPGHMGTAGICI